MNDIYAYTVPVFVKSLGGLKNVLMKAEAFAKEKGMSETDFLADSLRPDMFTLAKQVQVACDNAKGAAARLSGTEIPKYEDTEPHSRSSFARRSDACVHAVRSGNGVCRCAAEESAPVFPGQDMTGFDYAREYVLPNFFFHVVAANESTGKGVPSGRRITPRPPDAEHKNDESVRARD